VSTAVQVARQEADDEAPLRLVMKPSGDADLLPEIIAEDASQPDSRQVEVLFGGLVDRVMFLRDGRAQLGLLYEPLDDLTDLDGVTLLVEDRLAVLPRTHRLADQRYIENARPPRRDAAALERA
jgi:hypothetical protein